MKNLNMQKIVSWIEKKKFTVEQVFNAAKDLVDVTETELLKFMAEQYYKIEEHINCLICLDFWAKIVDEEQKTAALCSIIQQYYGKNIAESCEQYENNRRVLEKNSYFAKLKMSTAENLSSLIIYQDEQEYIYIDRNNGDICIEKKEWSEYPAGFYASQYLLYDINNLANLGRLAKNIQSKESLNHTGKKYALMIHYDNADRLALILQTGGISQEIFSQDRIVFMIGKEGFTEHRFLLPYLKPSCILTASVEKKNLILNKLEKFYSKTSEEMQNLHEKNVQYYKKNSEQLLARIRAKQARSMVIGTRFPTAFPDREYYNACERLGLPVYFLGEKTPLANLGVHSWEIIETISEFHPDIILYVDNFSRRDVIPEQIIYINWICSNNGALILENILQIATKDYFLAHFPERDKLLEAGYPPKKVLQGIIPTNCNIFRDYDLGADERRKYQADIILVSNFNSYIKRLEDIRLDFAEVPELGNIVVEVAKCFYADLYAEKIDILSVQDIIRYFMTKLKQYNYKKNVPVALFKKFAEDFYTYYRGAFFRTVLAEWLIDGGYTNLKLYGNDWAENPKFAPYAMGVAPYGEVLAKIYKSGKILLGSNPVTLATARKTECFLSGGFYMGNFLEPRAEFVSSSEIDDNGPLFHGRDDLYNKLDYYLANPKERERVIARVRQELLKYSTYDVLVKNTMQWLADEVQSNNEH